MKLFKVSYRPDYLISPHFALAEDMIDCLRKLEKYNGPEPVKIELIPGLFNFSVPPTPGKESGKGNNLS